MIVYKRGVNGVSNCSREAVRSTICPRLDMDARVATVILSAQATLATSHQLCAHVCVHRPAGSARSYARRPVEQFVVTHRPLTSGDSEGSPLGPKRDDVARVDLLSHYCCVRRQEVRSSARESTGGKLCYHTQCMNRNGMGPEKAVQSFEGGCQQKQPSTAAAYSRISVP